MRRVGDKVGTEWLDLGVQGAERLEMKSATTWPDLGEKGLGGLEIFRSGARGWGHVTKKRQNGEAVSDRWLELLD